MDENEIDTSALAPHPVYFSDGGKPASTSFELNGKKYRVDWDGHRMDMTEYSKRFFVWHDHPVDEKVSFIKFQYNPGCWGCLVVFSSTCFVWVLVFIALKRLFFS